MLQTVTCKEHQDGDIIHHYKVDFNGMPSGIELQDHCADCYKYFRFNYPSFSSLDVYVSLTYSNFSHLLPIINVHFILSQRL